MTVAIRLATLALVLTIGARSAVADLLSAADQENYQAAFAAARSSDWAAMEGYAAHAEERLPAKVLLWLELMRSDGATFAALTDFIDRNPEWPGQDVLRQRTEEKMDGVPDAAVQAYFLKHRPVTTKGALRFIDILTAAGQADAARTLLRDLWVSGAFNAAEENLVLQRHADDLRPEDHVARLDRLLWDGQAAAARRALPRVPEEWRLLGEARLALGAGQSGADEIAARIPKPLQDNPGLRFELVRWSRRQHRLEQAAALIRNPPRDLGRPTAWSAERDILLRQLLDDGKSELAYDLSMQRDFREGDAESADLEFISGWIALRRLVRPEIAYDHFVKLHSSVKLPVSVARGAYWAGRAAVARGAADDARRWFTAAAEQGVTYYGQLAASRLGTVPAPTFPDLPQVGADERDSFEQQEFVRVTRLLTGIGATDVAKPFLLRLDGIAHTPAEHGLVATLAKDAGCLDVALVAAKRANPGGPSLALGFPMIRVEATGSVEPPLVLAIIRQESGFDPIAVSRADARGLMQLQPATAKTVAQAMAIPFSAERLLTDPDYNTSLGTAYLARLLDTFNGSLVLAIAAYNAGPARVKQWIAAYGDPRDPSVDVVDWIEELPFGETRNYVQRVLENLQVYRLRRGEERAFTLARDLSLNREPK